MTIKAGVLGWPVAHSRSPIIHGHWLQSHGIDGSYELLPADPNNFETVVRGLVDRGYAGANVTVPHKLAALALADHVSPEAAAIGAANTLVFHDGQIEARNTDGLGFYNHLQVSATPDPDKPVLVLGAGGAAQAVLYTLAQNGFSEIHVANRTGAKADGLADSLGLRLGVVDWDRRDQAAGDCGLLINTTSLGMAGQPPLQMDLNAMPAGGVVYDLVYAPLETDLLAQARDRGLSPVDGLGMLLHQAVPGFEAWFGVRPEVTPELRDLVVADLEAR